MADCAELKKLDDEMKRLIKEVKEEMEHEIARLRPLVYASPPAADYAKLRNALVRPFSGLASSLGSPALVRRPSPPLSSSSSLCPSAPP